MPDAPICPYCGRKAILENDSAIYGRSYGKQLWLCRNFPRCDAYVGCHVGTDVPLGRMANKELREAKKKAHAAFDSLWRTGKMSRAIAYKWLAEKMGMLLAECHIGMFDVEDCERVVCAVIEREIHA